MRDYYLVDGDRKNMVEDLPTAVIQDLLSIDLSPFMEGGASAAGMRERLLLELFIRERNLRE